MQQFTMSKALPLSLFGPRNYSMGQPAYIMIPAHVNSKTVDQRGEKTCSTLHSQSMTNWEVKVSDSRCRDLPTTLQGLGILLQSDDFPHAQKSSSDV
jgi:hypothetical protein